jgi:hypothetical protein
LSESRETPSPSAYREQNPYKPPPPEYRPPSLLAEHKGLAILFTAILLGCIGYGWRVLHAPPRRAASGAEAGAMSAASTVRAAPESKQPPDRDAASSPQPIYIEALPEKDKR